MNNQEKAREIELDVYAFGEKPKGQFEAPAYRAALAMAEWKDAQFREYLEKKKHLYDVIHDSGRFYIEEIINELFTTIKTNNTENDE